MYCATRQFASKLRIASLQRHSSNINTNQKPLWFSKHFQKIDNKSKMASGATSSQPGKSSENAFQPKKEELFNHFYTEVKEIEKRDSVLTPKQQIERLLRPGSTYFNLNPFEVLQVEPDASLEDIKKKYRRMSILVHPDKNQDDIERAQQAFEIINSAWKILENEDTRAKCLDVIEEARVRTDQMLAEKRKKLKKEGKDGRIEEDDPDKYKHAVYVRTMKLFADMERKRRELANRDMEERKRKRENEIEEEEKASTEKEWQKNFEESRQNRVESWQAFQTGKKKAKKAKGMGFKPPKHKAESR